MNVLLIVAIIILVLIILFLCAKKIISYYDYIKSLPATANRETPGSYLKTEDSFKLEKICLEELEKHYKCQCKIKKIHFPFILDSYNKNNKNYLILTSLGKSLNHLHTDEKNKFKKINFDEQINCILYNLNKSKVIHLDMHETGKNLTINKDGHLGLIDFNIAYNHNFTTTDTAALAHELKLHHVDKSRNNVNTYEEFDKILKYNRLKD